ncbi:2-hydroxycarboxylate transporter [Ornithinimicrobium pratense]|uniref:2-hydroxycarboxylate transporter n=1 Tax=Ornithinimicrobium pratense TaxID=2593973 RepID=A0A5J6V2Z3_9MICO|nr:2-hydroxycarboxylate transporter [Ornithinimicrobium pratense]
MSPVIRAEAELGRIHSSVAASAGGTMKSTDQSGQPVQGEPVEAASASRGILGLPAPAFIALTVVVLVTTTLSPEGTGMTAAFAVAMTMGGVLMWVGSKIPGFNFIGGGVILCILVPAVVQYLGLFPQNLETLISSFYSTSGFGEFVVAGLITGSILGMPRTMLIKAGSRIIAPIVAVIAGCFLILGLIGELVGMGAGYTIFFIVGPVLGGGVAAGAIPISEIIAGQSGGDPGIYLTALVPAVAVANIFCIIAAGGMNAWGKKVGDRYPGFNGNGALARGVEVGLEESKSRKVPTEVAIRSAITGFILAGILFVVANYLSSLLPQLHAYVFLILICAALKIFAPLPGYVEEGADLW